MRILHIVESHTVHTQRIVDHQLRQGHEVRVLTFNDYVGSGPVTVVTAHPLSSRLPFAHHWKGVLIVRRQAKRFRPNVVHGHYLSTAALYMAVCPTDATIGSAMGSDILIDAKTTHSRMLLEALPRWVDAFTSGAEHVTRAMVNLGIPVDRISTFPWGVDTSVFHPPSGTPTGVLIVSTRSFEPVYDVATLVYAYARLSRDSPNVRLRLYGSGSGEETLRSQAESLGAAQSVEFAGSAPHPILAEGLRRASVYVSTSRSDAASVSLLEAMATGLIPVVSDIEANRSWIQHGENGLLFAHGDPLDLERNLRRSLVDENLRARARKLNPQIVRTRATWEQSMRAVEKVYRQVLK
jgi:glycosyltransferase involved in cell wall biosynthesis